MAAYPIGSMYGIFTYIWVIYGVNVGKYSIHGSSGYRFPLVLLSVSMSITKAGHASVPRASVAVELRSLQVHLGLQRLQCRDLGGRPEPGDLDNQNG